jgi:hypothetical protein
MTPEGVDRSPLGAHRVARWAGRWWTFPAVVAIAFCVLVGADLNGSSLSVLAADRSSSGLIAGTPRSIRTDEFYIRTPLAISSARQGFPSQVWIGLTSTDQAAIAHGGPTLEWSTLLKPQDWGYVLLGPSRGLAFSWWWSFAISLLGAYWLIWHVTRRPAVAAALAVAATFTPYAAWWTAPAPSLFLGYAALAGAAIVAGLRSSTSRQALAFAGVAGLAGAAFALALYPPWQVTLAWIVGAATLGLALDHRAGLRRVVLVGGVAAVVGGALTGAWFLEHRGAVSATLATAYPGQRVYHAGDASFAVLVDAPLNFWMTGRAGASLGQDGRGGPYANLSESASSWFAGPLFLLLVVGAASLVVRERRRRSALPTTGPASGAEDGPAADATTWTLALTSGAMLLLLAWSFLPLPDAVGAITLLQRAEPARTGLAIGRGQIVLVASAAQIVRRPAAWTLRWLAVATVAAVALTGWVVGALPWNPAFVSLRLALLSGAILAVLLGLSMVPRHAAWGSAALAIYALASWAPVNPLQRGIGPLVDQPLPVAIHALAAGDENRRVVVFGGYGIVAQVRAAGMASLSGLTVYPDPGLMSRLVPAQRDLWNNYAQYRWRPAPAGAAARIVQVKGTAMDLVIDPCDPILIDAAAPGWVVSDTPLVAPCLMGVTTVAGTSGTTLSIYRYVSAPGST